MTRPVIPIRVYDDIFDPVLVGTIERRYTYFQFGWKANPGLELDHAHWNIPLGVPLDAQLSDDRVTRILTEEHTQIFEVWRQLQGRFVGLRQLRQFYINGYTYGTDGYLHRDDPLFDTLGDESPNMETIIVYLNKEWDSDWGGETAIFDEQRQIVCSVLPRFGRTLIFDGQCWHASRPLSRACKLLRKVLVFKTLNNLSGVGNKIDVLRDVAQGTHKSGRSLFEHLIGVAETLRKAGQPQFLQDAGLFHSVYGAAEHTASHAPIDRDRIRQVIGEQAETLAHEFRAVSPRSMLDKVAATTPPDPFWLDLLMVEWAAQRDRPGDDALFASIVGALRANGRLPPGAAP